MENNQQPNVQPQAAPQPAPQPAPQYQQPAPAYVQPVSAQPIGQLKTNRSLVKFILLSIITFGIYALVVMSGVSSDINVIAQRYDGKKTMHYLLMSWIVAPITLGIYGLVWFHGISARIGNELTRRGINYNFGASDFWLWGILGSFIIVGPFIYHHKLFKAMNLLSEHYNQFG